VVVLAPQRQQVMEMETAGFPSPTTVANFLLKRELAEGTVVVVDEAGQIGGKQMLELIRLVCERNARLVLSGDTRQHGAVEASDALLAIERHSGIRPVELHKIRRQDPALGRDKKERADIRQYRKAVELAAAGKLAESFAQFAKMSAVVTCGLGEQAGKLADEYVRIIEQSASAVVVSQTWSEVHRVNSQVREALKAQGLLSIERAISQHRVGTKVALGQTQQAGRRNKRDADFPRAIKAGDDGDALVAHRYEPMFRDLDASLCRQREGKNFARRDVARVVRFGKLCNGKPVIGQSDG